MNNNLAIQVGKTYSRQFSNQKLLTVLKPMSLYNQKVVSYLCRMYRENGQTVERELDLEALEMLCFREYDENLKAVWYLGEITEEDVLCIQEYFNYEITENMIRQAISNYNYGDDWSEILNKFGIWTDTCNREFVVRCVKATFPDPDEQMR